MRVHNVRNASTVKPRRLLPPFGRADGALELDVCRPTGEIRGGEGGGGITSCLIVNKGNRPTHGKKRSSLVCGGQRGGVSDSGNYPNSGGIRIPRV